MSASANSTSSRPALDAGPYSPRHHKYTPGPWKAYKGEITGENGQAVVCECSTDAIVNRVEMEANVDLITVAPEMLEMLHWAQTAADRLVETTPPGILRNGIRAKADEMRDLIGRALGK